jgi:hypothetical protein
VYLHPGHSMIVPMTLRETVERTVPRKNYIGF